MENRMTPAVIEPVTFWFVAQHLNHCATAVPNLYTQSRRRRRRRRKTHTHKIDVGIHSSFLYLIFPRSVPLVQYNITTMMNKFFRSVSLEFFRIFSKPFSHSFLNFFNHMYNEFLQDVSWALQITRSQTVPYSDYREGVEQLKIQCYLSPRTWQH